MAAHCHFNVSLTAMNTMESENLAGREEAHSKFMFFLFCFFNYSTAIFHRNVLVAVCAVTD